MATNVRFHRIVQDSREFGSTETTAVSKVFFDVEVDGKMYRDLHVDVKEPVGSTHEDEEISIGGLMGVPVSIDEKAFKGAVRTYYQSLVTSAGFGKHLAKGQGFPYLWR